MDDLGIAAIVVIFVGVCIVLAGPGPVSKLQLVQPTNYHRLARQDAVSVSIDPDLFERQINQESGFNPDAVSSAGAVGIAQIMPSTAAGWGVDPHDPVASLQAAAHAMANYQYTYGSYSMALAAYNAGTGTLNTAIAQCGASWKGCLPAETENYISAIVG